MAMQIKCAITVEPGVNSIKLLQLLFKSVAIVSEIKNNNYTCELHL